MKSKELRTLSLEELKGRLAQEQETLQKLKFAQAISPIENPMQIRKTRRAIASINTELTAKAKTK
jgi:large subunit ribosomal protein L29